MEIKHNWKTYSLIFGVAISSFFGAYFLPLEPIWKGMATLPGIGSLFGVLFKIYQDTVAHERALALKEKEHYFNLSVTSHMAKVAFDKHAAFAEEYAKALSKAIGKFISDGPTENAMNIHDELQTIRRNHTPWVPNDVANHLFKFELSLFDIGITAKRLALNEKDATWEQQYNQMFDNFFQILGVQENVKQGDNHKKLSDINFEQIMIFIQKALGIAQLHDLKNSIIQKAMISLCDDNIGIDKQKKTEN